MDSSSYTLDDRIESDIVELSHETKSLSIQDKTASSPKLCFSFSKHGHCRFGENCKFAHRQRKNGINESTRTFLNQEYRIKNVRKEPEILGRRNTVNRKQLNAGFDNNLNSRNNQSKRPCRYFQAGYCSKDETCNFSHSTEHTNFPLFKLHATPNSIKLSSSSKTKKRSVPICYFFKRGTCHKGDDCKYYHQQRISKRPNSNCTTIISKEINSISNAIVSDVPTSSNENSLSQNNLPFHSDFNNVADDLSPSINNNSNEVLHPLIESELCSATYENQQLKVANKMPFQALKIIDLPLSDEEILQLRETEVTQLKKRFPGLEVNNENRSFTFEFSPSDPDWSHDVTNFHLQTMFPENYPIEVCKINVLQSTNVISETILRHLNESIFDWLNQRHTESMKIKKVELVFRPFLRWFDKNLDELFNSGLQKVKQDIFEDTDDSEHMFNENQSLLSNETIPDDLEIFQNGSLPGNQESTASQVQLKDETYQTNSCPLIKTSDGPTYTAQKLGVNILFMGLELVEGVAALSCTKLAIMFLCARCKTSSNVKTMPNKNNSITCTKCSKIMECNFNPSILHQFTNILGTVYLVDCQGVDVNLVECAFLVDCLNCSKQVPIQGIHYGPKQKFWCMFCNQKLVLSIESSKFQSSGVSYTSVKAVPVKKTEKKKDPSIKEGSPLPQFGACKHYKKSNRWLRFPCCGRVYPCDLCHDDKESDHEMKFASRMICGFCSKEQPYSKDKPCSSCSSNVVSKSGSHWEGGKGCRNKIKMARDDKKKYSGSSKTISKKSQNSEKKKK